MAYQYAFRAQKSMGVISCSPIAGDYTPEPSFVDPGVPARVFAFSPASNSFVYVLPACVRIFDASTGSLTHELPNTPNVIEVNYSPKGTYLSTWERVKKLEDSATVHKNLRIFNVDSGEEVLGLSQKTLGDNKEWDLQYTEDESYAIRLAGDVQIYVPGQWDKGLRDKAKIEGASSVHLSSGKNPSVAVFVKERKGAPASFKLWSLGSLMGGSGTAPIPTCQKTFYKADRATVKWNALGTQVLLMTQTDVDNTNKSYYGETGLYLLSAAGNFDARLTLDREGPIHDFSWSPSSKEFAVVYGYMPAKTTLFSTRLQSLYDFAPSPTNFVSFSPDTRFLILAGFGNLAGKIAVYERRNPGKQITTISAPNTTSCEWSPDGKFLMTSTLSPRLRVDNMIKIWHLPTGNLIHVQEIDELYWSSWRPSFTQSDGAESSSLVTDSSPPLSSQALEHLAKHKSKSPSPEPGAAAKPAGAYRPPGARGTVTPAIFKREDEGGLARVPTNENGLSSGHSTPRRARSPIPGAPRERYVPGAANGNGKRHVPGSAPSPPTGGADGGGKKKKGGKEREKGGKDRKDRDARSPPTSPPPTVNVHAPTPVNAAKPSANGVLASATSVAAAAAAADPTSPGGLGGDGGELDTNQKKIRNLNKKLKAIDDLKARHAKGEKLEATQIRKMDGEKEIRDELAKLSV